MKCIVEHLFLVKITVYSLGQDKKKAYGAHVAKTSMCGMSMALMS